MISAYVRLAAPLQSWAGLQVTGNVVRTEERPTRSALQGLLAAALGARRGEWPGWLRSVRISVRTERSGRMIDEFQTINPRPEDQRYQRRALLLQTGRIPPKVVAYTPDGQSGTSIVRRTYLADAEFLVRFTDENHGTELIEALAAPVFSPYLGRKGFAPTFPFFLGMGDESLLEKLPTRGTADPVRLRVDNLYSSPPTWEFVDVPSLPPEEWLAHLRDQLLILPRSSVSDRR